jgi:ribosomal protein L7/L12
MEWIYSVIVLVAFLIITWAAYSSLTARHKAEIRRLEQKIDALYRRLEINPGQEPTATAPLPASLVERVREKEGIYGRIEAIKAYREETGASLATAKEAVDKMLAENSAREPARSSWDNPSWDNSQPFSQPNIPGFSPAGSKPSLSPEVRELVQAKQKIQAIKLVRQQTGLGLKEAKDLVDAFEKEIRQGY